VVHILTKKEANVSRQKDGNRTKLGQALLALVLVCGVMALSPPAVAQTTGVISIEPSSGAPGSQALVTGSFPGYGTYDFVTIWWDYINDGRRLGNVPLRSDGTFALPVRIPPEASLGSHQVIADVNAGYDQAYTTFEVTAAERRAAYIYKDDTDTADDFEALLEGNGVTTTLLPLEQVSDTDLSSFDLILAGPDSGSYGQWGTSAAVEKVGGSAKPVLGLGEGGYALFGKLQLAVGYPHGAHGPKHDLYVVDPAHPVYNVPYNIAPYNNIVTLYSTAPNAVMINAPSPPDDVLLLGQEVGDETHYLLLQEAGDYCLWGYDGGPEYMTSAGRDLFINTVFHLLWAFEVDTLILTDYDRMDDLGYAFADVAALENDINDLRGQPSSTSNMDAIHRDISDDAPGDVPTDCAGWDGNEGDVAATNTCVEAIDDYIENLKQASYPNLYYVIIVGATEIIPMKAREQDHLFSAMEKNWGAGLPGTASYIHQLYSTPGAVNGWGHYLTDSIYGDLSYVADGWGADHELVPELAVGRLVETPTQISDLIDTYLTGNAYFSRTDRASIASDDYCDGGTLAADYMDPGTDDALVQGSFDSNDVPPKLNAFNDLVYLGGHGDYNVISTGSESFMAGNHGSYGDTADLSDMPDAVIVTSGCHNGASFGNQLYHAPDAGTTYSEFPEEFSEKLAGVYVGATGFTAVTITGSGTDVTQVRHNEKLSTYVIKHLDQDGNISAGEAFRRAVNSYVTDVGSIGTIERRVISITTLYGIPNYRGPWLLWPWPWPIEYWLEPLLIDPPPFLDPGPFRFRIELELPVWEIVEAGLQGEWFVRVPGAFYGGSAQQPLVPVFKSSMVLPPGSTCKAVEWDQAASESTSWTASAPMYLPPSWETPAGEPLSLPPVSQSFEYEGRFPEQLHTPFHTSTAGGAGTAAGLGIIPLQHDPQTLETTLWTKLAFDVTCDVAPSTDGDGDGLPGYWEGSNRLDPNDATGDDGATGDPDNDGLDNEGEFGNQTDPLDPDTDNDGWSDWREVRAGTNPLNPGSYPYYIYVPVVLRGP
jgi:hypothetical protein